MIKGLALRHEERYQSAKELLVGLEKAQSGYVSVVCPRSQLSTTPLGF